MEIASNRQHLGHERDRTAPGLSPTRPRSVRTPAYECSDETPADHGLRASPPFLRKRAFGDHSSHPCLPCGRSLFAFPNGIQLFSEGQCARSLPLLRVGGSQSRSRCEMGKFLRKEDRCRADQRPTTENCDLISISIPFVRRFFLSSRLHCWDLARPWVRGWTMCVFCHLRSIGPFDPQALVDLSSISAKHFVRSCALMTICFVSAYFSFSGPLQTSGCSSLRTQATRSVGADPLRSFRSSGPSPKRMWGSSQAFSWTGQFPRRNPDFVGFFTTT